MTPHTFPDATSVQELDPTPENRKLLTQITGPVKADWSNAVLVGHAVHIIDGRKVHAYVPERSPLTGKPLTTLVDGDERIIASPTTFPIPQGHPWHTTDKAAR